MLKALFIWVLKKSYNRTIFKVEVLDKKSNRYYYDLKSFCRLEIETDMGPFIFEFKRDRRQKRFWLVRDMCVNTYIVHLKPPDGLVTNRVDLSEKLVLAVKLMIFRPNYDVLTQVLIDIYLDVMLKEKP